MSSLRSVSWEKFLCMKMCPRIIAQSERGSEPSSTLTLHPVRIRGSVPSSLDELFTKCQPVRVSLKAVLNGRSYPTSHHTLGNCRHGSCSRRRYRTILSFTGLIQGLHTEREVIRLIDPTGPPQANPSLLIYSVIHSREKHLLRPLCLAPGDMQ